MKLLNTGKQEATKTTWIMIAIILVLTVIFAFAGSFTYSGLIENEKIRAEGILCWHELLREKGHDFIDSYCYPIQKNETEITCKCLLQNDASTISGESLFAINRNG